MTAQYGLASGLAVALARDALHMAAAAWTHVSGFRAACPSLEIKDLPLDVVPPFVGDTGRVAVDLHGWRQRSPYDVYAVGNSTSAFVSVGAIDLSTVRWTGAAAARNGTGTCRDVWYEPLAEPAHVWGSATVTVPQLAATGVPATLHLMLLDAHEEFYAEVPTRAQALFMRNFFVRGGGLGGSHKGPLIQS